MNSAALPRSVSLGQRLAIAAFCLFALLLVFSKSMVDGINHDEHQFVAPAALIARFGLQPYRDFPLFHLPDLTLVYSLFYKCAHPFLLARSFNALCAAATVCLIFAEALRKFASWSFPRRFAISAGFASLVLFAPLFIATSGKTWNHDLPTLLTVAGILLHIRAAKSRLRSQWLFIAAAGFCLGLAMGARLTFAPLAAPFLLAILFFPNDSLRRKTVLAAVFGVAALVAFSPVLWSFCSAPDQFLFGNFEYPRLRLRDPSDTRAQKTVKLWRKARFFFREVACANPALFGVFFFAAAPVLIQRLRAHATRSTDDFETLFFVLLIPFLFLGCFAPTRYQYQHFYVILPVFTLAAVHALATCKWNSRSAVPATIVFVFGVAFGAKDYRAVAKVGHFNEWVPLQCHSLGEDIQARIGQGKVLTFAPIYPLEAGLEIYPEFATGPFAMRLAHLVPPERRKKMHLVSRDDLRDFLRADPPAGILLGFENADVEQPLRDFARANGYRVAHKHKAVELWTPRAAASD